MQGKDLPPIHPSPTLLRISKGTMLRGWRNGQATIASTRGMNNGGGTICVDIPQEWFRLSYDVFLERVITLAAASHYGFTVDDLKEKKGLKEFFGFNSYSFNSGNI